MVREWVKVELQGANNSGDPRRFTCASNAAIVKGTLMAMTDPRTAIAHSSATQPIAGIAAEGKAADDLSTTISCWTNGIFEASASGAIVVGHPIESAAITNSIQEATTTSGALVCGYAMETAAEGEVINVRIRL